jgi:A/G-specific adenine glycosylase
MRKPRAVGGRRTAIGGEDREAARRIAELLRRWYGSHGRDFAWRHWRDEYRLAVVEVLLQRTRAEVVAEFIDDFLREFPDWESLARTPIPRLEEVLLPIGLHRRRAAALSALARAVVTGAPLTDAAPGVGQYISRAVAVAADGARLAMVDANFVRVLHRAFAGPWMADYRFDPRLQGLAQAVVDDGWDAREVNWAILDLGSLVCKPRSPRCEECPLSGYCNYATAAAITGE